MTNEEYRELLSIETSDGKILYFRDISVINVDKMYLVYNGTKMSIQTKETLDELQKRKLDYEIYVAGLTHDKYSEIIERDATNIINKTLDENMKTISNKMNDKVSDILEDTRTTRNEVLDNLKTYVTAFYKEVNNIRDSNKEYSHKLDTLNTIIEDYFDDKSENIDSIKYAVAKLNTETKNVKDEVIDMSKTKKKIEDVLKTLEILTEV